MKRRPDNYERRDVDIWRVGWVIAGLVGVLILCCVISASYFKILEWKTVKREGPILSPLATRMREFPQPRLQADPNRDLKKLREREQSVLDSYRWIDREQGVIGIPIEVAMELIAERGLPEGQQEGISSMTWRDVLQQRANAETRVPPEGGGLP